MPRRGNGLSPTMNDVARLAGVSQSCVSVVLNDAPGARVPSATRQRVRKAAEKLGYELPTPRIRTQPQEETPMSAEHPSSIAFIVDEISVSPHSVLHIDGARDGAWTYEQTVQTFVTRSNKALQAATVAAVRRDPSIAGVIYGSSFATEVEVPDGLEGIPIVLLNCHTADERYPTILADDVSGGYAATQYLAVCGHERIAMVNGERWMDVSRDRLRGFREALAGSGLEFDPALVKFGDWSVDSGYRRTIELLRAPQPPTAFYCASDLMALGCIEALADNGLSVPGDVSVVGHNDIDLAAHVRPALSSCRPPNYEMGKLAVDMLLDIVNGHAPATYSLTRLESRLVVRASVAYRQRVAGPAANPGTRQRARRAVAHADD